ncbi:MAG: ABC transporter permease [Spirochaetaceae bacterium]
MALVGRRSSGWRNALLFAVSIGLLLALWFLSARLLSSSILLPGPGEVLRATANLFRGDDFLGHVGATLWRSLVAFAFATAGAGVLGIAAGIFPSLELLLRPWVLIVRSTPVISIILLTLVLLRSGVVPAVVALLITFPLVYVTVVEGVSSVDPALEEMSRLYRVPLGRRIRRLYIPSVAPFFLSGLHAALGLTFKVVAAAEVLAQPRAGVGSAMQEARILLKTAEVLAWTVVLLVLSALGELLFRGLRRGLGPRPATETVGTEATGGRTPAAVREL